MVGEAPITDDKVIAEGHVLFADLERRAETNVLADRAAVAALRDTAKWIVGGVALASGGIIAGSSLTALGSLGFEPRLLVAACAAVVGLVALGWLLWIAIDVLAPRIYDIHAVLKGETIPPSELEPILKRAQRLLPVTTAPIRDLVRAYDVAQEVAVKGVGMDEGTRRDIDRVRVLLHIAISGIRFEHCRMMFLMLKRRLVVFVPVVALSFSIFAWAANPANRDTIDVVPMMKEVEVPPNIQPALRKAMSSPGCVTSKIAVIVLSEHRSGAEDVVTIPTDQCAPVRLRLDGGMLAPAK